MNTKRLSIQIAIIAIFSMLIFVTPGWAVESGLTFDLTPTAEHPDASGTAFIGENHVSIQARGLKPDAVYTVWFVKMKPKKSETGAGTPPFMFRTDQWGDGSYSAALNEAPFGDWSLIMVVLHPDGNPKNMRNMVGALKAPL